ncbi:MAG TPA: glucose-6-phosphate dehydrogenase assembly protein OpcA [Blastocatellia bacterium]|nr:glucose-6-phosphate dehydrogenase assembly protein OpcA [Blastocatellia bacterium]
MGTSTQPPSGSWIDVAAIERELIALWQQASEDDEHGGVIRSSILNLLVFVPQPSASVEIDDILTEVTAAHPSRAILMLVDREASESKLEAQVTSRCTLPTGSSKQVCCEQVTITAAGSGIAELPSTLAPLLLSDLPVYLWWRAVPRIEDKALFRKLADISDRVIIDSSLFTHSHRDIASMASVLRDTPRWTALSDLNWARLTAWRALLAAFYDVKEYRPLLDQLDRVVIEYAPPAIDPSAISPRALLLGGWLASRLGWEVQKREATSTAQSMRFGCASRDDCAISLEFAHTERQIEPGHLALVTLHSAKDESILFSVRRSADGKRIETSVTRGDEKSSQRVLSYEGLSESELIGREIQILGHDRVYEQAVLAAGELVRSVSPQ